MGCRLPTTKLWYCSWLQIWRLLTNFFFLGGFSIQFAVRLLMLWVFWFSFCINGTETPIWHLVLLLQFILMNLLSWHHILKLWFCLFMWLYKMWRTGAKYATTCLFEDSLNKRYGLTWVKILVCDVLRARYGVELEKTYVNRTADFLWMIMISMTAFLVHSLTFMWPVSLYRFSICIVCFVAVHMGSSF